jgi:seryl-tRNA synthetase
MLILLCDYRVPEGNGEEDNKVVFEWGYDLRKIGDTYQWHDDLAVALGGLDPEAAIKMSGSRFSVLKGGLAQLERAIIQYFLDFHTSRGYTECSVPFIVTRGALEGTGQLPKFEEDLFKLHHQALNSDTFLIPTAEVPLTNIYKDCILESSDLPIKLVSHTPSFRSEVGNHGRDTRGLLRQHQFHKVELVKLVTPETSDQEHEAMCQDAELLLQSLLLPYRKVLLCSGDLGFTARICYDLEVWLPGQQLFREISSISNCYDFQANRMNVRYRPLPKGAKKTGKKSTAPIHTLNGSGLAVGRYIL